MCVKANALARKLCCFVIVASSVCFCLDRLEPSCCSDASFTTNLSLPAGMSTLNGMGQFFIHSLQDLNTSCIRGCLHWLIALGSASCFSASLLLAQLAWKWDRNSWSTEVIYAHLSRFCSWHLQSSTWIVPCIVGYAEQKHEAATLLTFTLLVFTPSHSIFPWWNLFQRWVLLHLAYVF